MGSVDAMAVWVRLHMAGSEAFTKPLRNAGGGVEYFLTYSLMLIRDGVKAPGAWVRVEDSQLRAKPDGRFRE